MQNRGFNQEQQNIIVGQVQHLYFELNNEIEHSPFTVNQYLSLFLTLFNTFHEAHAALNYFLDSQNSVSDELS